MSDKKRFSIKNLKNIRAYIAGTKDAINLLSVVFAIAVPLVIFNERETLEIGFITAFLVVLLIEIGLFVFIFLLRKKINKDVERLEREINK